MIEYHETLNPKLWLNNKLIPEVKSKLIEIYQTFINKLKENEIPIDVIDVLLLGSNASYNYTDSSDIDLHIVTDFENLGLNNTLAQIFYNNEKSKFNDDYDISIKGLPVEVYIEDINAGTKSNGIYSLLQDKWLKFPEYNPPKEVDYSFLLNIYQNKVNNALQGTPEQIKSTINEIKMLRKISLMNDGEYSKGNLVFKELRNNSSIDNLYNKLHELTSKELSLEKMNSLKEVTLTSSMNNLENNIINSSGLYNVTSISAQNDYKRNSKTNSKIASIDTKVLSNSSNKIYELRFDPEPNVTRVSTNQNSKYVPYDPKIHKGYKLYVKIPYNGIVDDYINEYKVYARLPNNTSPVMIGTITNTRDFINIMQQLNFN